MAVECAAIARDASRVGKTLHNICLLIIRVPLEASKAESYRKSSNLGLAEGCEYFTAT
jgi:hypothetical protein